MYGILLKVAAVSIILFHCISNLESQIIQRTEGDLLRPWNMKLQIYTTILKGVLVHCEDSKKNNFYIQITKKYGVRQLKISYNRVFQETPLKETCGCQECGHRMTHLYIEFRHQAVRVKCNNHRSIFFIINDFRKKRNYLNEITISIANDINNQRRSDLEGCLEVIIFNSVRIAFHGVEKNFQDTCINYCINELCKERRENLSSEINRTKAMKNEVNSIGLLRYYVEKFPFELNIAVLIGIGLLLILIVLCAANLFVMLRRGSNESKRNVYEDEVTDNKDEVQPNLGECIYNTVDYSYIRGDKIENDDDYLLPNKKYPTREILPPIPPRNI